MATAGKHEHGREHARLALASHLRARAARTESGGVEIWRSQLLVPGDEHRVGHVQAPAGALRRRRSAKCIVMPLAAAFFATCWISC